MAKVFNEVIFGVRNGDGVVEIEGIVFAILDDGEILKVFRQVFHVMMGFGGMKDELEFIESCILTLQL